MKRLVFDLKKTPFLKRLIAISRLIVEVLNDQNLFTDSSLADWFSSYVQFCSGGHFSELSKFEIFRTPIPEPLGSHFAKICS